MIERLVTNLKLLAASTSERSTLAGDFADALRLVIDCPQIRLEPEQQAALERVEDALERGESAPRVADLARRALAELEGADDARG